MKNLKAEIRALVLEVMHSEIKKIRDDIRNELVGVTQEEGIKTVIEHVLNRFSVSSVDFMSKSRKREFVEARQVFHWLIRNQIIRNRLSLRQVGLFTGSSNHATVMHSCRAIDNLIQTDQNWREKMMVMVNELGQKVNWNGVKLEIK